MKLIAFLFFLIAPTYAIGATVQIEPDAVGHYYSGSSGNPGSAQGYGGSIDGQGHSVVGGSFRHFMIFDLSSVLDHITSARLDISAGHGRYLSVYPSMGYNVWSIEGDLSEIDQRHNGGPAFSHYSDLGSGTLYGVGTVDTPVFFQYSTMPAVSVDLIGALPDLNLARGDMFGLGGSAGLYYLFNGGFGTEAIRLVLETEPSSVPLPGSALMLGSAMIILFRSRFRERQREKGRPEKP